MKLTNSNLLWIARPHFSFVFQIYLSYFSFSALFFGLEMQKHWESWKTPLLWVYVPIHLEYKGLASSDGLQSNMEPKMQ